jgi:hypothetical protein
MLVSKECEEIALQLKRFINSELIDYPVYNRFKK